ncbi:MAG TPA: TlpA disulfide reductase family protein, partial [Kofleriaceae bacterium]|nr:TlpA disulfide reductase family protein [Kofleriaceae bacterium]
EVAPEFVLPELGRDGELTGKMIGLGELRGRVVLIDFWAEWCGPCREAIPVLGQLQRRYGPRGLTVLSVKIDGRDLGQAAAAVSLTDFPLAVDDRGVAQRYQAVVLPHLVLVDRDGTVRRVFHGRSRDLVSAIEGLL